MAQNITFDVIARDRATATFNRIAESTATLESRFTRFQRAATGVATTLVGAQVGKSVLEAADQFELSRSRLETITKNVGGNFDDLSKQVDAADRRMAAFGFTSADTEGALASLESVTKDPTKALGDLALAADIARGRNIGLSEATLILQRVETGHVAQLAKLGIATKDANGHLLTQAQALQMLTDLYGGAASNYAGTFAGKQAAVAAELKNAAAQIGVALLPAAVDLANALQHDVLPPLVAIVQWFDRNRKVIEPLVKDVLILTAAWKGYTLALRASEAITALMGRTAVTTTVALEGEATAAAAAGTAASAGGAIGAGMAGGLGTGAAIASRAVTAIKYAPAAGVGGISDLRPQQIPTNLQDLLNQQSQILKTNPAAAADFRRIAGANGVIKETIPELQAWINKWKQAPPAINAAATATTLAGGAAARTAEQIASHAQKTINFKQAQDSVRQAMHDAAQTAADSGRALTGNSDAALANRNALMNQVSAVLNVIDVMKQNGSSAANQKTMLDILTQAVKNNADKIYGNRDAVRQLLAQLGLVPEAVDNAAAALATLPAITQAAFSGDNVSPGALHQLNQAVATTKATAAKQGADVAKSFTDGYSPIVAKVPKAASAAATKAAEAFNKLKDRATSDLQSIRDAVNSTQSSLTGFAAFSTTGTDALGASGASTDFIGQKRAAAQRLEQFAHLYGQLTRSGLNPDDLHEFVGLGPAAIPAMQALIAAGKAGIRTENRLDQRIHRASGQVAALDAGSQNAGLIHKDLAGLPGKIGQEFRKGLRDIHITTDSRGQDRKNGIAVVTAP